jgi:ribosomal protein S18 acetylase RimI-like enzyme
MNIRPASFRDLARIESLYAEAGADNERHLQSAQDHPVPQATLLRVWYAVSKTVSSLVPFTAGGTGDTLFVAENAREGIVGFIRAQAAQGKSDTMQILNLCVTSTASGHFAREQLLTHLTNHGAEHGVHRFLVRLPVDDALVSLFVERGFVQLATEQILYSDDASVDSPEGAPLRPARRDDVGAIYLLYLRTTPSRVASLEGPSLKSWQSGFADGSMARLGRDDVRHLVLEDPGVVGWASIRPASATRPTLLSLMCDGHDPRQRENLVGGALGELPPGPVSSVLRHYDSELIRCLQKRGFAIYGTQVLLVRDLASRVRLRAKPTRHKPVLIQANLAHSVPVESPPLRVLRRGSDPSPQR